jgi:hypothetical protein
MLYFVKKIQKRNNMAEKIKICRCPIYNCDRSVDITEWNMIDPMTCMCCGEQFELEEVNKSTIKEIEKTW